MNLVPTAATGQHVLLRNESDFYFTEEEGVRSIDQTAG
jgi:hypothetical protein